ncbi:MAG: hydrolase 2, exosortase A system-associated [Burkholderiales bacterium]|nr:hydrolase 2, exosortase A system-associated [Burkholderiales bacterium]
MGASPVAGHFLAAAAGPLAVVVFAPPAGTHRFSVLYVPPFADEMNKSRRMAALQARALAAIGGQVALVDLRGTGDSAGDHAGAAWEGWHQDIESAWSWLGQRSDVPCVLWGLRLGALLAVEAAARGRIAPAALLLWNPVTSGRAYFNQVLRVATIQERLSEGGGLDAKALRAALAADKTVEVAGYELAPALVSVAEKVDLMTLGSPRCPVIWRDVAESLAPATQRIAERFKAAGAEVDVAAVAGSQFWAAQEITQAPALVASTTAAIAARLPDLARLPA